MMVRHAMGGGARRLAESWSLLPACRLVLVPAWAASIGPSQARSRSCLGTGPNDEQPVSTGVYLYRLDTSDRHSRRT